MRQNATRRMISIDRFPEGSLRVGSMDFLTPCVPRFSYRPAQALDTLAFHKV